MLQPRKCWEVLGKRSLVSWRARPVAQHASAPSALRADCTVSVLLQNDQRHVQAAWFCCLHKLVMTSCSCHKQNLFPLPEKLRSAHGPHMLTCIGAPAGASVGKAKNKCQARVTEQPHWRGKQRRGCSCAGGLPAGGSQVKDRGRAGSPAHMDRSWLPALCPFPCSLLPQHSWGTGAMTVPILQPRGLRPPGNHTEYLRQ